MGNTKDTAEQSGTCQLIRSDVIGREPWLWQFGRRYRQVGEATRRFPWYLVRKTRGAIRRLDRWRKGPMACAGDPIAVKSEATDASLAEPLTGAWDPGTRVRVRMREQIERTLDIRRRYKGCPFADPMFRFCGQEFQVFKRVEQFFDEAQQRMVKCRNIVLLKDVFCDGMGYPQSRGCDRTCFYFWRTEWLERID